MSQYISGRPGPSLSSDLVVNYEPKDSGGVIVRLKSKVQALYGERIEAQARQTMTDLGLNHGALEIEDAGALPFVIAARIEAAVKMAHPDLKQTSLPQPGPETFSATPRDRFRRSRLYVPGNQPKLMLNAGIHGGDGIILDLEDAVALTEKDSARLIVRNALIALNFFGAERMVRINQGERGRLDLMAVVPCPVHLILIPKVEDAEELETLDREVDQIMADCGRQVPIHFMPILESARGILNALTIAKASPRNVALAIGLEDYTADIGTQRSLEGTESFFARSMLVNAARAAGIQPIDTVFSDVSDMDGLRQSVVEAKQLGFDGKGCIHPRQIGVIHEGFAPEESEIQKAVRIVRAFDKAQAQGLGVVSLGSKMIDPPVVKRALRTVDLAVACDRLPEDWREQEVQA